MGDTLRICLVTTFYPPYHFGGDAVFVQRLADALARRGHGVDVVHSEDAYLLSRSEPAPLATEAAAVRRLPLRTAAPRMATLAVHQTGGTGPYAGRLQRIFDAGRYDVIHFHNVSLVGGPGVLRCGDAVKLYTAHEYWLVCPTHVLFKFDTAACERKACLRCTLKTRRPPQLWRATGLRDRCLAHVDRLLMPSRFALQRHRDDGVAAPMELLPHFVPLPQAPVADAAPAGAAFLFVGRLERLKGVQDLIEAFRGLPQARLRIVGSGNHEDALRRQAAGLANIEFLGALPPAQVGALYREAIAVLAPSLCFEVFGLAPAEAMAHGVPVVVRRIGALTELVEESGGGLLFDTPEGLRAALLRLLVSPTLRAELGAKGRRAARERWSEEAHLDRYMALIDGLRERRSAAAAANLH